MANCGAESGGFYGSNRFISSPPQMLHYLSSFDLPMHTKLDSPISVLHLFSPCLVPLCLFPSKNCCIKSEYFYVSKTFAPVLHSLLSTVIAFSTSSLQSTHPHTSAAQLRFPSKFPQLSQAILTCKLFRCWQQSKKHVKSLLRLLILFILYVWNGDKVFQI